ncbi:mitogen-activated protein kinase kinase kinase 20-like [Gossypium arboreum]|uniref:mitogen-activated protein kinase kinase kinase 20-like n=1 Tax=Gossypium arboreum TaxID=29729 RepID=UPI00081953AC|nr:mitogen-activated protein kinase kinase kinase 20-like [Gossypium arboreum]
MEVLKIKVLGKGSYGVVYLVKTVAPAYNQIYALKSANEEYSLFLRKEEEILLKFVNCSNIIQCYGGFTSVEREQRMVYNIFLEYAPGGSLLDLIKKYGGKIPERDVNCYTQMILEGLLDIHEKGYIHSDLKPGNILVFPPQHCTRLSTLKIADFGLAKREGVQDTWIGFRGTKYYMSPESIVGEISGALDIWSLGCIVVQMITGRLPWDTCDGDKLNDKLLRGESPNIPEDMSELGKSFLKECFVVDPNKRWNASKLLCHPYLLLPEHMLPRDDRQSLPCFQQKKVLRSRNIPPPPGFNIPNSVLLERRKNLEEQRARRMISSYQQRKAMGYLCV